MILNYYVVLGRSVRKVDNSKILQQGSITDMLRPTKYFIFKAIQDV